MMKIKIPERIRKNLGGIILLELQRIVDYSNVMIENKILQFGIDLPCSKEAIDAFVICCCDSSYGAYIVPCNKGQYFYTIHLVEIEQSSPTVWDWLSSKLLK